ELARLKDQEQRAISDAESLGLGFANDAEELQTQTSAKTVPPGSIPVPTCSIPVPAGDTVVSTDDVLVPSSRPTALFFNDDPTTRFPCPSNFGNQDPLPGIFSPSSYHDESSASINNVASTVEVSLMATKPLKIQAGLMLCRKKCNSLSFKMYGFLLICLKMDDKSVFLYERIDEEVYVTQPKGFVDPQHPKKVYKVVKALYGLHQAPRAWIATTPYEGPKPKYKNKSDSPVNVYIYRSMIESPLVLKAYSDSDYVGANKDRKSTTGGYQFLGRRLISWQCKKQTRRKQLSRNNLKLRAALPLDRRGGASPLWLHLPLKLGMLLLPTDVVSLMVQEGGLVLFKCSTWTRWPYFDDKVFILVVQVSPLVFPEFLLTPYTITEDLVRSRLQLADDGGIDDLPIAKIYSGMDNLGYVTKGKLTFFKNKFSPQWRFLVYTLLHCLSPKSGSWDQFGSPIAVTLICLSDGRQFNWHPMPLSLVMLLQAQAGKGAEVAAQAVPQHMPAPDQPQAHLSTPPRQQTSDPNALAFEHGQSSFHMSPPGSTQAPPAGQPSGGTKDSITLTALSSVVSTLVQKVNSLETELKDHKKLFKDVVGKLVKKVKAIEVKLKTKKRKMVVSDSDQEEGGKKDVDLDALRALANAAVTVDYNIPPGGAFYIHAACTSVPTVVPTGASSVPTEMQRRRQQEVLDSAMYYTEADWINIMAPVKANASLSKILLGDDVSEDNFPARMAALIKRKKQALAEKLVKERQNRPMTCDNLSRIKVVLSILLDGVWLMTLKRTGPVLEDLSSKRQKSTEALISSVLAVPPSPAVSSPPSFGTRRKSLDRKRLTKPQSKLDELNLDANNHTFIKVVSNEDSDDDALFLWFALIGWEVVQYYETHLVVGAGLILWGDLQVLYMFANVYYPLSVKLMEKMLTHKLEIDSDVVGNDMTTAEQLIQFIKNQLVAAQVSFV
nr:ribonuclease H-like domain, reverse transcriptase, RNA-dependent DNA polymerase [Tanacetum cinerariifolium]